MKYPHAIVWLDEQHATVIGFSRHVDHATGVRNRSRAATSGRRAGRPAEATDDPLYFAEVAEVLDGTGAISLIVGPGATKVAFRRYLDEHRPAAGARVIDVDTVERPSERRLLAIGRKFFKPFDDVLDVRQSPRRQLR